MGYHNTGHKSEHKPEHKSVVARPRNEHIKLEKIAHMVGVAEYMRERADDYGIDGNVAYTAGMLHDIGYLEGRIGHEEIGAEILEACGMRGEMVFAVANHAAPLKDIPKEQVSPLLVLMVEADLSVDMRGFRIGFDGRLDDIAKRYKATSDSPIFQGVLANVEYIKEYQKEHGIPTQDATVHHKSTGEHNHGSGKWVGSQTKAELIENYKKESKEWEA